MTIYIERGYESGIGRSRTVTPSRAVTQTNSFVISNSSSSDTSTKGPHRWRISAYINSSGNLVLSKGGDSTATGRISYTIVSCDQGEFTNQYYNKNLTTAQTSTTQTITSVPLDSTFVVASSNMAVTGIASSKSACSYMYPELTDSTTVTLTRNVTNSLQLNNHLNIVTWAGWTGVKVYQHKQSLNQNLANKVAKAHGHPNIDPDFTWLLSSFGHSSSGLEQSSIAVSMLDSSGVGSSTNIYYQRRKTNNLYASTVMSYLIRFPDNSIEIATVDNTNTSTGTTYTIAPGKTLYPDGVLHTWTNNCSGTGTAFARPRWNMSALILVTIGATAGSINYANMVRGYSGQTSEWSSQFIDLGNFKPQNPTMMMGCNF